MSKIKSFLKHRMLIIGDSFVEGVGADKKFGWAQRFSAEVKENLFIDLSGIGGDTVKKVLNRQSDFLKSNYDFVVLEVGLNDSRFRPSLKRHEVALDEFRNGILEFIETWRLKGAMVAVVGLTRVDENKTVPYKEDKIYRNSDIDLYDNCLKKIGEKTVSLYMPVPVLSDNDEYLADGIHPSTKGHEQLFNALKKQIFDLIGEKAKYGEKQQ